MSNAGCPCAIAIGLNSFLFLGILEDQAACLTLRLPRRAAHRSSSPAASGSCPAGAAAPVGPKSADGRLAGASEKIQRNARAPGIRAIAPLLQAQEPASAVSRRGLHPARGGAAVRHAEPCVPRCRRWSIRSRRVAGLPVRAKNPKEPESCRNRGDCAVATGQTNPPRRFRDVACMPRAGTGGGRTDPVCRARAGAGGSVRRAAFEERDSRSRRDPGVTAARRGAEAAAVGQA
jgi:hypothetical protein